MPKPDLTVEIYIPTRGRVGRLRQQTLQQFTERSSYKPILVCPPDEVAAHQTYAKRVQSCAAIGIGPTRQWLTENAVADIVVMSDDDLTFAYREVAGSVKLTQSASLDPMIDACVQVIEDGYIHGGVSSRQDAAFLGDHRQGRWGGIRPHGLAAIDNYRVNNFHFFHRRKVINAGARFDMLPVMEDFYFTLQLLTAGFPNRVLFSYCWNQRGSGADGGCSLYRTAEVQRQGAEGLALAFPNYVNVLEKQSKSVWKGMETRADVRVQWLKAFKGSTKNA